MNRSSFISGFVALVAFKAVALLGCSSSVDIDVQLVDPCNQQAVGAVDFLRFRPRGTDVDTDGLTTTQRVTDRSTQAITIPLVADFQLVATGHKEAGEGQPAELASAIGVSAPQDLTSVEDRTTIAVPFALVDTFYKATSLADPGSCSNLQSARFGATAALIPGTGHVLLLGGVDQEGSLARRIEIYSSVSGNFEGVGELRVEDARTGHTATVLDDGRVLVVGGQTSANDRDASVLESALIVDAREARRVSVNASLRPREKRTGHQAVLLSDGRVLIIGGRQLVPGASRAEDHKYLDSIEIFDPKENVFTLPSDPSQNAAKLTSARFGHSATLLPSGREVLVAGGMNASGAVTSFERIRIDGNSATVTPLASVSLGVGPIHHAAVLTSKGVLFSGGYPTLRDAYPTTGAPRNPSPNVEIWNVISGSQRMCTATVNVPRARHSTTVVGSRVLFVGGRGAEGSPLADVELATLTQSDTTCFARITPLALSDARSEHAMVTLESSGEVLVLGGNGISEQAVASAELFSPRRDP